MKHIIWATVVLIVAVLAFGTNWVDEYLGYKLMKQQEVILKHRDAERDGPSPYYQPPVDDNPDEQGYKL